MNRIISESISLSIQTYIPIYPYESIVNSVAIKLYLWHCRTAVPLLRVSFKEIQTGPWSFALIIFHLLRPLVTYIRRYIAGEWRTKWLAATRWSRHWLVWRTVENFIENTSKLHSSVSVQRGLASAMAAGAQPIGAGIMITWWRCPPASQSQRRQLSTLQWSQAFDNINIVVVNKINRYNFSSLFN